MRWVTETLFESDHSLFESVWVSEPQSKHFFHTCKTSIWPTFLAGQLLCRVFYLNFSKHFQVGNPLLNVTLSVHLSVPKVETFNLHSKDSDMHMYLYNLIKIYMRSVCHEFISFVLGFVFFKFLSPVDLFLGLRSDSN